MSDRYDRPVVKSKDDFELRHHIVYYTFWPVLLTSAVLLVSGPVLWFFDHTSFAWALRTPWIALFVISVYFGFLGDHVIPSETYRKIRSGEWGDPDGDAE